VICASSKYALGDTIYFGISSNEAVTSLSEKPFAFIVQFSLGRRKSRGCDRRMSGQLK